MRQASVAFILVTLLLDILGIGLLLQILPKLVETLVGGGVADASIAYAFVLSV